MRFRPCRWCRRTLPESHYARGRKGCLTCLAGAALPSEADMTPPSWPPNGPETPDAPCPMCREPVARTCSHQTYCSLACRRQAARLREVAARASGAG